MDTQLKTFTPSFNIFKGNGQMQEGIKRAFLHNIYLDKETWLWGYITLEEGTIWHLHCSDDLDNSFATGELKGIDVICSFQVHKHGNYAVCRPYKEGKEGK